MVDPEGPREPQAEPATPIASETVAVPEPGAEPQAEIDTAPGAAPGPTGEPAPAQTFELPTARHVVGSGMALAVASTRELRRASIYIGLLVLGAFGPSIVATLLILGRLGDAALDALAPIFGAELGAAPEPALEGALLMVLLVALVGLLLFVSISIDAQVIAIALLGGHATDRPLRLWEAILRARQAFWRMAGAGTLVGLIGFVIQSLIIAGLGGFSRSDEATSIAAALLATLVTAPLAYVSTCIVLGDVGAMEAISRSWRLFRARRSLAIVVTLFTLVASAIQLFAFSAGLDLVSRFADFLHLSLAQGTLAFATATVLILAGVIAYGSLTFTIAAVVAAPQVTSFLGLTFYSGGLDRARAESARPPRGFRYVSAPMAITMGLLAGVVGLAIPAISSIPVPAPSAALHLVRDAAMEESDLIDVFGYPVVIEDPAGDGGSGDAADVDIIQAEAGLVEAVPAWLLDVFGCGATDVACGRGAGRLDDAFVEGAFLFVHRFARPLEPAGQRRVVVLLSLETEIRVPLDVARAPFSGASRVFTTTFAGPVALTALRTSGFDLRPVETAARAMWRDDQVFTLVPAAELPTPPTGWDAVVLDGARTGPVRSGGADSLRSGWESALSPWDWQAAIFVDDYR